MGGAKRSTGRSARGPARGLRALRAGPAEVLLHGRVALRSAGDQDFKARAKKASRGVRNVKPSKASEVSYLYAYLYATFMPCNLSETCETWTY